VKHWGARLGSDTHRGYNGYVIRREGRALLFGGDTAYTPLFASHRQHGPFDAAIMPIGAYDPFIANHCTPEQAVTMADAAGARLFVPVHHQTFRLSHEPFDEPIARADAALAAERGRLVVRQPKRSARDPRRPPFAPSVSRCPGTVASATSSVHVVDEYGSRTRSGHQDQPR
jgi:L-ascorbate metabolism protein UlaG (beta-lactamase superfamily)